MPEKWQVLLNKILHFFTKGSEKKYTMEFKGKKEKKKTKSWKVVIIFSWNDTLE